MVVQRIAELTVKTDTRKAEADLDKLEEKTQDLADLAESGFEFGIEIDSSELDDIFDQASEDLDVDGSVEMDGSELDDIFDQASEELDIEGVAEIDSSELDDIFDQASEDLDVDGSVEMDGSELDDIFDQASEELVINATVEVEAPDLDGLDIGGDAADSADNLSQSIGDVGAQGDIASGLVEGLAGSVTRLGGAAGPISILAAAITAVGVGAFSIGSSFDKSTDSLIVATGASDELLESLEASVNVIAGDVNASLGDVSGVVGDLNTLLAVTDGSLDGLGINLIDAAELLGEDTAGLANSFGKLAKQIGLSDDELIPLSEGLFKLTQDFGIGFTALTDQLATLRPVLGFAFDDEEIAGFVATLDSVGLSATQIQGPFGKFLKTAADAGEDPRKAFEGVVKGITEAKDETEALQLGFEAFGSKGGAVLVASLREGTISLDDLGESFDGTAGLIQDTEKEVFSITQRLGEYRNQLLIALEPVGESVFDSVSDRGKDLQPVLDEALGGINAFKAAFDAALGGDVDVTSDGFAGFMEQLANTIVVDVLPAVQAFSAFLTGSLVPAVASIAETFGTELLPVIEDRLLPIFSDISTLFVEEVLPALGEFATFIAEDVAPPVAEIAATLADFAGTVIEDLVIPIVEDLVAVFREDVQPVLEEDVAPAIDTVSESLKDMKPVFETIVNVISAVVVPVFKLMLSTVVQVFGSVVKIMSGAITLIRGILTGDLGEIVDGVGDIFGGLVGLVTGPLGAMKDLIATRVDQISGVFKTGFSKIGDSVDFALDPIRDLIDWIKKIPTSIPNPFENFSVPNLSGIPGFAFGGITTAPSFITSEFGHEEAIFPTSASIPYIKNILAQSKNDVLGRLYADFEANQTTTNNSTNTSTTYRGGSNVINVTVEDNGRRSIGERKLQATQTASAIARRLTPIGVA